MQIYKFNSILKPVLWGGDKLLAFKNLPARDEPIGESWELSAMSNCESIVAEGDDRGLTLTQLVSRYGAALVGEDVYRRYGDRFPLLIKFIDAKRDLSVQVHPDEDYAAAHHGSNGKTEMWYVLQADEGAIIQTGFNRTITREEFDRRLNDSTLLDVINAHRSKPGDLFFIPPGQIHTIGAGNMVVEIQESCDITYRVWDYDRRDAQGNRRELHLEQAREVLDFNSHDARVDYSRDGAEGLTRLVTCPKFEVSLLRFDDGYTLSLPQPHSFVVMIGLAGETTIHVEGYNPVTVCQGETVLVPAAVTRMKLTGQARLLTAMVPIDETND